MKTIVRPPLNKAAKSNIEVYREEREQTSEVRWLWKMNLFAAREAGGRAKSTHTIPLLPSSKWPLCVFFSLSFAFRPPPESVIRYTQKQRNKRKVALEVEWADLYRRGEKYNALISAMVHNVKHFYDYLLWHFEESGRNVIFYSIISGGRAKGSRWVGTGMPRFKVSLRRFRHQIVVEILQDLLWSYLTISFGLWVEANVGFCWAWRHGKVWGLLEMLKSKEEKFYG